MKAPYTTRQGQFLGFIHHYTDLHGRAPSEAEMAEYFHVAPPTVHQMVLTLERRGLISRVPGEARSIRLKISAGKLPSKKQAPAAMRAAPEDERDEFDAATDLGFAVEGAQVLLGENLIGDLFAHQERYQLEDQVFIPLLDTVIESFANSGVTEPGVKALRTSACGFFHRRCLRENPRVTLQDSRKQLFSYLAQPGEARWHRWI